ncbi:MAG: glycosyltransferase [Bacteroidales bacterium]|nr:glycosyltransferase [Bacteroidales bacterium]
MRILQLCNKPPLPPVDGGAMGLHFLTECLLEQGCEVKVLSVASAKHPVLWDRLPKEYLDATGFEAVEVDLSVHPIDAGVSLLCGDSYNVKRYESPAFEQRLTAILKEQRFDIVVVESIYLTPYLPAIRKYSDAKVVVHCHNVEHEIWRRNALQERQPMKRWYLKKLALSLRMYELEHLSHYDAVVCVAATDAATFRKECPSLRKPMFVLPFGVVPPKEEPTAPSSKVYHLGAMDWLPNQEGVRWLAHEVWPLVRQQCPDAELYLAGRRMDNKMMAWQLPGVHPVGEVEDAAQFLEDKGICLVPLFAGSGIRVKMIEAMAAGKAVVSTSIGVQGIEAQNGEHLLIGDTAADFAHQVVRLLHDDALRLSLATKGRQLIDQHYNRHLLSQQIFTFFNNIIER